MIVDTRTELRLWPFRRELANFAVSPLVARISRGAFWSLAGSAWSRGLNLLGAIMVARLLGKHGFGELGTIQNTVSTFQVFAGFGLGVTATKYIAQLRTEDPDRAGRILALSGFTGLAAGFIFAAALYFSADIVARSALAAPHLAGPLRIGAGLLFFAAINGAQTGALAGLEAFRTIAKINVVSGVLTLGTMVAGALTAGLQGVLVGLLVTAAATCLLTQIAIRSGAAAAGIPIRRRNCWREWSVLWRCSFPAVLSGAAASAGIWAAGAILVNQPQGYGDMGAYSAVMRIKQVPEMVLIALMAPILPVLSSAYALKDAATFSKTTRAAFAVSFVTLVPFGLVQIAAPNLALWPYGPQYAGYGPMVRWLMLQTVIVGACYPVGILQLSMGRMWMGTAFNVSWAAAFVGLSVVLVPRLQGTGLAASFALAYVVMVPATVYLYRLEAAYLREAPFWKLLAGAVALSGFCCLLGLAANAGLVLVGTTMAVAVALLAGYKLTRRCR